MIAYLDTLIGFSVLMLGISLLITILNQIISSLLAHRGSNMRWGLEVLFKQLDPNAAGYPLLVTQARSMAETILTHPLISDSIFSTKWSGLVHKNPRLLGLVRRWQLASGLRPEELSAVLTQIVAIRPVDMSVNLHAALRREVYQLLKSPSSAAIRQGTLSAEIAGGVPAGIPPGMADKIVGVTPGAAGNIEEWFGKIEDRIRQRFTMWMRIWTAAFAFAIAGFGCVDAIGLISALYTNSSLRAQLVNAAPQTTAAALRLTPDVTQLFTDALNQAVKSSNATALAAANISSPTEATEWMKTKIADSTARDKLRTAFDKNVNDELTKRAGAAGQILSNLSLAGLPHFGFSAWKEEAVTLPRVVGVLISALLLSLGAPFWFNTLSSLTSLRPLLAGPSSSQQQSKSTS
jgi:hypothetical protein